MGNEMDVSVNMLMYNDKQLYFNRNSKENSVF